MKCPLGSLAGLYALVLTVAGGCSLSDSDCFKTEAKEMSLYFLQREHFNRTTPTRLWLIWQRKLLQ